MGKQLFADHNPFADCVVRNAAYLPLIRSIKAQKGLTDQQLGDMIGSSQSCINRLMHGKRQMTEEKLQSLFHALEINHSRAYNAVIRLKDWRLYDDAFIILLDDLVGEVLYARENSTQLQIERLPAAAVRHLGMQLNAAIIQNDREVATRRERVEIRSARA